MPKTTAKTVEKTRIQTANEEAILDAALDAFGTHGFRGTTVDQIAAAAGLSKPNLLYYFKSKDALYVAVLERTLENWLQPLLTLDPDKDPVEELSRYIRAKLEMSRDNPKASQLFANEILSGAPRIAGFLKGPLKKLVNEKAEIISGWIKAGKIRPVDPQHFIFSIWAVTQHYADFGVQVDALLGNTHSAERTERAVVEILLRGLKV